MSNERFNAKQSLTMIAPPIDTLQFTAMEFPIRSPYDQVHGIVIFARIASKIRLHAKGELPEGYHTGVLPGTRTFDDRLCKFLNISFEDLSARVLEGGTDEEVLEWCFAHGHRPDAEQIEVWNAFMTKRGWRDSGSAGVEKQKAEAGLADRTDIVTYFDAMNAEEGRG
jgi:hypothetical protein